MINSYKEFRYYLHCDYLALSMDKKSTYSRWTDPIWRYQKTLRKLDYLCHCRSWRKLSIAFLKLKKKRLGILLGFSMPFDRIGPGLCLAHYGLVVISHNASIGANCKIHCGVNIGATGGRIEAPKIGDSVYIGPGAKIVGDITIADRCVIGANAVVVKSILENGITVAGVPAKKISDNDSKAHLVEATSLIRYADLNRS